VLLIVGVRDLVDGENFDVEMNQMNVNKKQFFQEMKEDERI
jgi:hypothetical protein